MRLSSLAALVCLLVGVLPPALLFALEYRFQRGEIVAGAEINARLASELINRNPELWRFEQLRLEELLGNRPRDTRRGAESRTILSLSGAAIASSAEVLPLPLMAASAPLFDAGRQVGELRIVRSLRPAVMLALLVALGSATLAAMLYFVVMSVPLRALRKAFADLDEERERALITLQSIGDAVVTTDARMRVQSINPVAGHLTGWTNARAHGQAVESVFRIIDEDSRAAAANPVEQCLLSNRGVKAGRHAILVRQTDGREFHIEYSAAPIRRASGEVVGAVMVFHDISERKQVQNQLHHIAHHDGLTSLPNRTLFQLRLQQQIQDARAHRTRFAVLFLDLDRFKLINDTLGHLFGDQLLLMAAKRLRMAVRAGDTIARIGGDEFTAILRDIGAREDALCIASEILDAIRRPFHIGGHEIFVTTSIGVAFYPEDGTDVGELLKNADVAMYQAKDSGRNSHRCFVDGGTQQALERLRVESEIRGALERDEFFVEYQPKLDLVSGHVVGMEALLRWRSATKGIVSPDHFIPLLEASGGIIDVGQWALRTAVAQAQAWERNGFAISIAVNFSVRQFEDVRLVAIIEEMLDATDFPPARLEIEVTESLLMQDENHQAALRQLSAAGIHIALDDFGTGYSSLGYLRSFPIDVLKIDKSFINELAHDAPSLRIVRTVIDLGHALNMVVVAEGVETAEQCAMLKRAGCDLIQGYWLSRPMPGAATLGWLQSHHHAALREPVHSV
jgi:diguanylate cyclase (GGDEF)-like protein/PAS domain S-box-containing protein